LEYALKIFNNSKCGDEIRTWNEWIEPLTLHGRHPLYLLDNYKRLSDVDYILLKSLHNESKVYLNEEKSLSKRYFFDAGSSTWDTDLYWFWCAYHQVRTKL